MKKKPFRRIWSIAIALCMVIALLPVSALASTTVTPSPNTGNSDVDSLEVEYFSSTLYNWDEDKANTATADADMATVYSINAVAGMTNGTLFTITAVDGGYTVSTTIDGGTKYLTYTGANSADAKLSDTATTLLITDNSKYANTVTFSLSGSYSYPYLNYYNASGCGGWSSDGDDDQGSRFYIMDANGNYVTVSSISSGSQYYIASDRGLTNDYSYKGYLTYTISEGYEGKGFYFTNASNKQSTPAFSSWSGTAQNYTVYTGLAASKLSDSSNAPFNDETVNAANLFASSSNTYTSVYSNVQVPFYIDEDGYYVLDSDTYGVYFTGGTAASEATMSIANLPSQYASNTSSSLGDIVGFAPFNNLTTTTASGKNSSNQTTTGYAIENSSSNSMVYGFGMVTSVDFQMTDDGKIDGEDIIFEFSGDDDVWVYIDDVLVLDIGGTHDAITGTINFRTGDVTLKSNYNNTTQTVLDAGGNYTANSDGSLSETNLYTALETTLTGFSSEGTHTMTIYYMDRGRGKTNCLIKFNLPQEDNLSVTKDIADTYTDGTKIDDDTMANLSNIDFSFTLYNGEDSVVANESYSLYDADGNFVQSPSTDSNGQFTLRNGYTAVFNNVDLDEEGSWYVVENLSSSRWVTTSSYTAIINGEKKTDDTGTATSGTVELVDDTYIGSDLSADSIAYVFTNQYVKGADPDVDVYDETIVLDYGLPVEVDVTENDISTLYGKSIGAEYNPSYELTLTGADDNGKYIGKYGYAEINKDGNIVYTLTEDFCGIETVKYTYSVTVNLEEVASDGTTSTIQKTGTDIGTLTIIPATSVYYEEDFSATYTANDDGNITLANWTSNFISISTNDATFSVVDDEKEYGPYQETGLVGTTNDSTYGTDEVYLDNLGDSYGTSLKVDTEGGAAQYKYTFTGTNTTIYGRVSSDTAYIKVTINEIDENGNEIKTKTNEDGEEVSTSVDTQVIDTINLISTEDGDAALDEDMLYNIPIYQSNGLNGYSTYVVRIYVYKENTYTGTRSSGGEFYLDGIRVFNPMGTSTDDNEEYSTASSAYATDGEANMEVINIRQKVAEDYYADDEEEGYSAGEDLFTLTDIDGEIADLDTYLSIGPNEEFYLNGDSTQLTFALVNWSSSSYKLYLGLKAPTGKASSVTFSSYVLDDETDVLKTLGTIEINNSSDCYYDISSYVDVHTMTIEDDDGKETDVNVGFVTITGDAEELAALTNLKVTGVDSFNLGSSQDLSSDTESDNDIEVDDDTIYAVSAAYAASLFAVEEEESVFEPESFSITSSYSSKTKKATITIVASTDVSYVTINGTKITGSTTTTGKLKFSKSYTKVTKGTAYEVIAWNADGVASETYIVTAE